MKLVLPVEARFSIGPEGGVWIQSPSTYEFYSRYLSVFDEVLVVGRAQRVANTPTDFNRVTGPRVGFRALPHVVGTRGYAAGLPRYLRALYSSVGPRDAVLLRLPAISGSFMAGGLGRGRPFGVELVGDARAVFTHAGPKGIAGRIYRGALVNATKKAVSDASSVSYVTDSYLQERYPAKDSAFATNYSSVELPREAFARPKTPSGSSELRVVTVGTLAQPYKGMDTLIRATASARRNHGLDASLTIVGDGRLGETLLRLARELGVEGSVSFMGQVSSGEAVRSILNTHDVFALASRTEGLPRAMLEAMALGLPAIGTNVGGIPELLPADLLCEVDDYECFANRFARLARSRERYAQAARQSVRVAERYSAAVLKERRLQFYADLREETERWIQRGKPMT